jgi:hypothetical protein
MSASRSRRRRSSPARSPARAWAGPAIVNWRVAGSIVIGWVLTLPAAAGVAALVYGIIEVLGGGEAGVIVISAAMAIAAALLWRANRAKPTEPEESISERPAFGPAAQPEPVAA